MTKKQLLRRIKSLEEFLHVKYSQADEKFETDYHVEDSGYGGITEVIRKIIKEK
jgi:hypothetical protein